jgi:hypothetical protein
MSDEFPEWTQEYGLSEDDKSTLSKYDTPESALEGGANAIRLSGSPDRIIKGLDTLDMDKLDDSQRQALSRNIARINGVPDSPVGYDIARPDMMPDGMQYDYGLENWLRDQAHKRGWSNASVNEFVQEWNKRQFEAHEKIERAAEQVERDMMQEMGQGRFTAAFGKNGDPNMIGNVKRCLMTASRELGLDYKDENGFPQSRLLDELEMKRKDGRIGDRASVLKFVNWVWDKYMAEGGTGSGGGGPTGYRDPERERIDKNKRDFPNTPFMHK